MTPRVIRDAGLAQAGFVRVRSLSALVDTSRALAGQPAVDGDRVAIVSNAGGPGVMAADAVADSQLRLARFDDVTTAALRDVLPAGGSTSNPIDTLATADLAAIRAALDAVLDDESVAGAVVISAPSALFDFADLADQVAASRRAHGKPVTTALMGGNRTRAAAEILADAGIGNVFDPAGAVAALDALARARRARERARETADPTIVGWPTGRPARDVPTVDHGAMAEGLAAARDGDAAALLAAAGIEPAGGGETAGPDGAGVHVVLGATSAAPGPAVGLRLGGDVGLALDDVAARVAPVDWRDAAGLVGDLRGAAILSGVRGRPMVDLEGLVEAVQRAGALVTGWPVTAVEVDLAVTPSGVRAHDWTVRLADGDPCG